MYCVVFKYNYRIQEILIVLLCMFFCSWYLNFSNDESISDYFLLILEMIVQCFVLIIGERVEEEEDEDMEVVNGI